MALSPAQVEGLLRRCERRRRLWQARRTAEAWGRSAWPGLLVLLLGLAIARASGVTTVWVAPAVALVLLGSLAFTLRGAAALRVPRWWLPARVDRAAGAHGALMERFETGQGDQPVPLAALSQRLGPGWPVRLSLASLAFALAYAACLAIPVPSARAREVVPLTPIPVQRAQRWLARVEPKDATTKLFVDSAKRTLARLGAKTSGLERADFDALERIEERAKSLLERQSAARALRQDTLDAMRELDDVLASYEAARGGEGTAGALRDTLERRRDALERGGLSSSQLKRMLEQARAAAERGGEKGKGGAQQPGFDPDAAEELRKALEQARRELKEGDASEAGPGKGGIDRGPGVAPLMYSEQSKVDDASFEANTFETAPDRHTVLLGTGLSRRDDERHVDPQGQSTRTFEQGTDTELWPKHIEPRHRAVLERYFEADHP